MYRYKIINNYSIGGIINEQNLCKYYIAKNEHYASFINSNDKILVKPFKFTNELTEYKFFKTHTLKNINIRSTQTLI